MTPEQYEKLQTSINATITEQIKIVVNGKIDKLDSKLETYIITDNIWKQDAQASIELGKNVNGFGKVFAYVLGTIAGVYGIIKIFKL